MWSSNRTARSGENAASAWAVSSESLIWDSSIIRDASSPGGQEKSSLLSMYSPVSRSKAVPMRRCSMTKLPTGRSTVVRKYITRSLMAVGTMRWLRPQV